VSFFRAVVKNYNSLGVVFRFAKPSPLEAYGVKNAAKWLNEVLLD
jgi:hypothetical protein